jgi:MFS family permease
LAAWGLFAAILFLMMGRGLIGVLVGVRAELEGFSTNTTGIVIASYFVGFLAGSQVTPRLLARVGHIRVFSGLASIVAVAALGQALWIAPVPWIAMRLIFGFCIAGLAVVAESWLNEAVTNENRGRAMAVYMVVSMGGVGLGQLLLGGGDPAELTLFLVAGALVALAVVPVSLSVASSPEFHLPPKQSPREIWKAAPLGVVGALFAGMANSALLGMGAVYAAQVGMSIPRTALFVGAAALGAVVLQWPIGQLSDIIGRRPAILWVAAGATAVALVGIGLDPNGLLIIGVMFLFGGLSYTMYSLALSHVIDVLPAGQAVTASSTNIFVTGVGAIFGPLIASVAMSWIGPDGFWWTIALAFTAIGLFAILRLIVRPTIEGLSPEPYMAVPARSAGIVRLVRRNGKRSKEPGGPPESEPPGL